MTYTSGDSDDDDVLFLVAVIGGVMAIGGAAVVAGKALFDRLTRSTDRDSDADTVNDGYRGDSEHIHQVLVKFDAGGRPDPGVLKQMGYRVGRSGLGASRRRSILEKVYGARLVATSMHTAGYVREWGEPNTRARATKIERALAGFVSNARRREADMSEAIDDWESDLAWLKARY